jgi:hypothetical protein
MAVRDIAIPPFMILPMGEIDAKEKNPDVRSGFDMEFTLYAVPLLQRHFFGARLRFEMRTIPVGINPGELRTEEQNQRRIINPRQYDDRSAGRPVGRGDTAPPQVHAGQKLSKIERITRKYPAEALRATLAKPSTIRSR